MLEELELGAPHVGSLEEGEAPEERHVDRTFHARGVADEDGDERVPCGESAEFLELGDRRVSVRVMRAAAHPHEDRALGSGRAGEGSVGPVGDRRGDFAVSEKGRSESVLGARVFSEGASDERGQRLVGAWPRSIGLRDHADVAREALDLRRVELGGFDLDVDVREDTSGRHVPTLSERELRVGVKGVRVISLLDDPARVFGRGPCRSRGIVGTRNVEQRRELCRLASGRLAARHDRLHLLPPLLAVFSRRSALSALRELTRSVAGVLRMRGERHHSREPRTRERARVEVSTLERVAGQAERALESLSIDRACAR